LICLVDADATEQAGRRLAPALRIGDVIALYGELGAGKTSFARGILAGLGLTEEAPSPSFPVVIPYDPPQVRLPVWHVDLYRLGTAQEAEELGLDEALSDGALMIEWPERLGERLWPNALQIHLCDHPNGGRNLTATVPPSWEARWPFP
jgi:tRNA threonylcarbamoyladenosine biosynthesis protein TsaE